MRGPSAKFILGIVVAELVSACAPTPPAPRRLATGAFRPVSSATLRATAGEPAARDASELRRGAETWSYGSGLRYQIERDQAVARAREPVGAESRAQYWNQRLAGRHDGWRPRPLGPHAEVRELVAASEGVTVWWDPSVDRVTKIWEYAPVAPSGN